MDIPFKAWTPDLRPKGEDLVTCQNMMWEAGKLVPTFSPLQYTTNAVSGTPLILASYPVQPTPKAFVGTTSKIYRLDSSRTLTDVSKAGGYTVDSDSETWDHAVYGDVIVMVSIGENPQILNPATTGTNFADLGGSPPKASCACMFKDHLFLGNVDESGTAYPRRLWRSKKGDIENWTVSSSTGCGYRDIPAWGEDIVAIEPLGNSLVVYMTKSIWLVEEIGSPLWFSYNQIASGIGTLGPNSVIAIDQNAHIFLGESDIYILTAEGPTPIGSKGNVATYFRDKMDIARGHLISADVDERTKNVFFAFHSTGDATFPSNCWTYNYATDQFTEFESEMACFGIFPSEAFTIDDLDFMGYTDGLNRYPIDSSFYNSPINRFGMVDQDGYISLFVGDSQIQILKTAEIDFGDIATVKRIMPIIEQPQGTVTVKAYSRFNDISDTSFTSKVMNSQGNVDLRVTGRYAAFHVTVTGYHSGFRGLNLDVAPRGKR